MKYFLDKSVSLRRLRMVDTNRSVYSATGTASYACSWQEPSPERQNLYEGQIGNLFECYVDITNPAVDGDQVVRDSLIYSVKSVKVMDFGSTQYKRLTVVKGSVSINAN